MKNILKFIFGCIIVFSLTGCVSSDNSENLATNINGETQDSFNINETAVFKDVHYTLTKVSYSKGDDWDKPADGNNYVIVTIKIENKSDSQISYNVYDWSMVNSQGQKDDAAFTTIDNNTNLSSGELMPGGTKTGTIVFEEPKNESSLKLLYYNNSLFDENESFKFIVK